MADGSSLRLEVGGGGVGGEAVAVIWDLDALAGVGELEDRPFVLAADLDGERWELVRILSAAFADDRLLAVAAARPLGAPGHGAETIAGALVRDGEASILDETLLSVAYDGRGEVRRVGLELYETPESLPVRVAGDRRGEGRGGDAILDLRADGIGGTGRLSMLRPS